MKEININNFSEKIYYEQLTNKMDVYLLPLKNKTNFFCNIGVKYGSIDLDFKIDGKEVHTTPGIAHFLEHKMFDVTNPTPFEFYNLSGSDVNAATGQTNTNYYFIGNNNFSENLKFLLNWIFSFKTTEEKVAKERGIIIEEAHMYEDSPYRKLYEETNKSLFFNDYRKLKTIGEDNDINSITKEELDLCYKSFYRPDNMYLIVVGGFDENDAMQIIKNELKKIKNPSTKVEKIIANEPKKVKRKYKELKLASVSIPIVNYAVKVSKKDLKRLKIDEYNLSYYLYAIVTISFGSVSKYKEHLQHLCHISYLDYSIDETDNYYIISINTQTEQYKKFINSIKRKLSNIKVDVASFERIKKVWIASEVRVIDNITASLRNIKEDICTYNVFKNNKIKDIKNLDYDKLCKVIDNINLQNSTKVVIKSIENK